ncbi:cysteine desulfurase family protein [Methylophaga sp. OBS4]|uniref:cysteine desulfurase family protein n=1 Tax=Methylophaga sp. OBS4 TaxID=2991935 RepID=UPI00224F4A12|nr:cysteine desulfurase family protein [Methylophaga sp. OBS4]MCX4186871.1 cysteine desulfurase [Methylophaga sp. OBS4]
MQIGKSIYLDYQATTPLDPRVREAMEAYSGDLFANPHSLQHVLGQQSAVAVESARTDIEAFIGASAEEIIFTSGATEANNQAIASVLFSNNSRRNKILISAIEHKCIKNAAYYFAAKLGAVVEEIPVLPSGLIDIQAYESMLSEQVLLVCVMAVNNEIGSIQDIPRLAKLAHDYGALFHCDAAQAPEAIDINVKQWQVDMLSLSAHKVYGPKGIGALYMKNALQASLPPFIHGGGQQFGMRSGTVPTALCVGFATALNISKQQAGETRRKLASMKQRFINNLSQLDIDFRLNGSQESCHPGNLNVEFVGLDAIAMLESMQPEVCASTGSACNSEMVQPSHVLKAIGLSDSQAISSIRFSLGRYSDENQIDHAVQVIRKTINSFQLESL